MCDDDKLCASGWDQLDFRPFGGEMRGRGVPVDFLTDIESKQLVQGLLCCA